MRAITFAVAGNNRLGASVLAALHDMGHDVMVADSRPGPLTGMAEQLGVLATTPGTTLDGVEWLVHCGPRDPQVGCHAVHEMSFVARAPSFPPPSSTLAWQWRTPQGPRQLAHRHSDIEATPCGADIAGHIEADALALLVEIVSQLGRDALALDHLQPVETHDAGLTLDLHALAGWHATNETRRDVTLEPSLAEMVSQRARATPTAVALRDADGDVDYRTFVACAMHLADRLAALPRSTPDGDGAPRVVVVRLRKSRLLYTAILGAIGAGAAYAPLDPSFPPERVRLILEQSRADCLITDDAFDADVLGDLPVQVIRLTAMHDKGVDIARHAWPLEHMAPAAERGTRCAITIFTSGSTGTPKGVMLSHRSIVHFCHWYRDYIGLDESARALQFCTVAFDVSLLDIFPTFLAGATLVIPTEEQRHALDDLSLLIAQERVTHAFLPPALLGVMPDANWPHLRHLLTGGDVCFPETIARWSEGRQFHNIFGPAECTVLVTAANLRASDSNRQIGGPIANVRCYVLLEDGQPCRTNEAGELCVAGAGVADGYLHRPDLTERSFVPNPFARANGVWPDDANEMLYRTGDIVQWDEHGVLHFVGRRDAQVKIRGFRVELGEIEGAILATDLYHQCAGVVDERKRIRVFVAKPRDGASSPDALREALAARLPDYMLPHEVQVLDALPATNNGKIDRAALASLPSQRGATHEDDAPLTPIEAQLRTLWARLLDLSDIEIGRDDSFFHLGGHSLLVSRLMLAVKREFGGNAPLARFMERPTISALASLLTDGDEAKKGDRIPPRVFEDMRLPDEIRPVDGLHARRSDLSAVLLTGANGFLGSFIAAELIAQTRATVYCLVRANSVSEGEARLAQALQANGLGKLVGNPRLKVVLGELTQPHLGLARDVWHALARDIDAIYHNGAHVNHFYDYPYLYDANVGATLELLRLACEYRNKSLHFVSTLSAASTMDAQGQVLEAGPALNAPAFVNNGYNVTKWVAEHLVWEAAERGIDATLLRPGNITGVAHDGLCQPARNRVLLLVKGSLQLGWAPAGETDFDFTPVDFLAHAIVRCTTDPQRELRVFHLQNPQPLTWENYLGTLARMGYTLTLEEPSQWRQRLPSIDETNALFDVVAFYLDDSQEDIGDFARIDHARTAATLARLGVAYPVKDTDLLERHFRYLIDSGFLPLAPPAPTPRTRRTRDAAPVA